MKSFLGNFYRPLAIFFLVTLAAFVSIEISNTYIEHQHVFALCDYFFNWAILGLFFFIFVFSIQLTVNKCSIEILPLTGFEVGVGSDRCTNWATNTPLDNNVSFLPYLYKTDTPHHHNALPCAIKLCLPKKLGCCCHDFKRKGSLLFSLDCEVST